MSGREPLRSFRIRSGDGSESLSDPEAAIRHRFHAPDSRDQAVPQSPAGRDSDAERSEWVGGGFDHPRKGEPKTLKLASRTANRAGKVLAPGARVRVKLDE